MLAKKHKKKELLIPLNLPNQSIKCKSPTTTKESHLRLQRTFNCLHLKNIKTCKTGTALKLNS